MNITSLILGLVCGAVVAYLIFYLISRVKTGPGKAVAEERMNMLQLQNNQLSERLSLREQEVSVRQSAIATLEANIKNYESRVSDLSQSLSEESKTRTIMQTEINQDKQKISELTAVHQAVIEKLASQKTEIAELQTTAHLQFEKIANQIFEEKSEKFTQSNKVSIEGLLNPLKEDIGKFKTKVEETYDKESKQRFSLEEKVKDLIVQTNKVSSEANNLATALKTQTKKQGNWGEMILERILETSGLTKDREYFVQQTIKDEEGNNLRPDILVRLPDDRVVIIDSKVSLIAYDRFSATEIVEEQKMHLDHHLRSVYGHIDDLSGKKYDNLENSLDFTMLFVPIEPAYMLAIQSDSDLWAYAYQKRILLISPTNLIACLRLITDLWKREKQSRNAMEIVKRGELMYEKFVTFVSVIEDVGKHIGRSQSSYETALDLLKKGRGNLVDRALQLHSLGLKSSKKIPPNMLPLDAEEGSESEKENKHENTDTAVG
jgi:DNA recombination protein RmuC